MGRWRNRTVMGIIFFLMISALISGSRELYYLFFVAVLFRLVMHLILVHNYKNLFIIFYSSANKIETGEHVNVEYKVSNTSFLPIPHAKIEFFVSEKFDVGSSLKEIAYFKNYQMINFSKEIVCKYRGYYKLGKAKVEIYDPMLLSSREIVFDKEIDLIVRPKVHSVASFLKDTNDLHGTMKSHEKTEEDRTNIANIRPFERGDQLKNIHWKLTAKTGELQTKVFEQTLSARFFIVLNGSSSQFKDGMRFEDEEEMVSCCASYVKDALQNGVQTRLMMTDIHNTFIEVKDSSDFENVIESLTGFESNGELDFVSSLQQLMLQSGRQNTFYLITYSVDRTLLDFLDASHKRGFVFKLMVFRSKSSTGPELLSHIERSQLDIQFRERDVMKYE